MAVRLNYFLGVSCPEIHDDGQEARKKAPAILQLQEWNTKIFDVEEEEEDGSGG